MLLPFSGQSQESSLTTTEQFAVYGKTEQKSGIKTCCSQLASPPTPESNAALSHHWFFLQPRRSSDPPVTLESPPHFVT